MTPQWEAFRGNNHKRLPPSGIKRGGGVSFARHLGKLLSPELWEDLYERLGMISLRVYGPSDSEWADGRFQFHADVYLDEGGFVRDVCWHP